MTVEQRKNIGHGVRVAAMRKRQSEAMKASWARRRAENGALFVPEPKPTKRASLREIAELLGIDTDAVIRHEIKRVLEI
jgi:hypothetical protein